MKKLFSSMFIAAMMLVISHATMAQDTPEVAPADVPSEAVQEEAAVAAPVEVAEEADDEAAVAEGSACAAVDCSAGTGRWVKCAKRKCGRLAARRAACRPACRVKWVCTAAAPAADVDAVDIDTPEVAEEETAAAEAVVLPEAPETLEEVPVAAADDAAEAVETPAEAAE